MKSIPLLVACALWAGSVAMGAGYRQSLGIGALEIFQVKVSGTLTGAGDASLASKTNRDYLDGFNRVDSSGNLGEGPPGLASRTGYFSFTRDQQVDLQRGTLSWHALSPADGPYVKSSSLHGRTGAEIFYRVIRERGAGPALGLEARAGYLDVNYSSSDALVGSMRLLTDAYALGGVVPQPAPYTGSFAVQPGTQRIGDTPTRSISSVTATVQGHREFSAKGWLLRLGVVWLPISTANVDLQLHAGPAALKVEGAMQVNERWVAAGLPPLVQTADGTRTKWLAGVYAGAAARVRVRESWELVVGADFLDAGTVVVRGGTGAATFDFTRCVLVTGGVAFRF